MPTYPRKKCIAGRVAARLAQGQIINHREVDFLTGSYRLAGYIHYLEESHHWQIMRRQITEATRDPTGRKAVFTEYFLSIGFLNTLDEPLEWAMNVFSYENERRAEREAATPQTADYRTRGPVKDNLNTTDKNE